MKGEAHGTYVDGDASQVSAPYLDPCDPGRTAGLVLLLGGLSVIVEVNSSGTMTLEGHPIFHADASLGSALLAGMFLLVGLLSLVFAGGLWRLARWAYRATVILQIIGLVNSVIAFAQAPAHVAFIVIGMINPVLMLLYLLVNPRVRAAFRT